LATGNTLSMLDFIIQAEKRRENTFASISAQKALYKKGRAPFRRDAAFL